MKVATFTARVRLNGRSGIRDGSTLEFNIDKFLWTRSPFERSTCSD